jgi:hypothetical protein
MIVLVALVVTVLVVLVRRRRRGRGVNAGPTPRLSTGTRSPWRTPSRRFPPHKGF